MSNEPRSVPKEIDLPRLIDRYGSEDKARAYLTELRWPSGAVCPRDGHKATWVTTRKVWDCGKCGYQFTVRVGTVFQDSKLPLWKWFIATFLMAESRKGISANQVRRMTGTSYKTAWFLTHRIREAMSVATAGTALLSGTVEMDEAYIGGKPRNRRIGKRGWDHGSKTMVLGAVERGGNIKLRIDHRGANMGVLHQFRKATVSDDAAKVYTDQWQAYRGAMGADADTRHETVNHRALEYVWGDVHTNTIESAWSLFKRSIVGSYHHLSVKHLDKYLDEFEWRFNNRANRYLFRDTMLALLKADALTYSALKNRPTS